MTVCTCSPNEFGIAACDLPAHCEHSSQTGDSDGMWVCDVCGTMIGPRRVGGPGLPQQPDVGRGASGTDRVGRAGPLGPRPPTTPPVGHGPGGTDLGGRAGPLVPGSPSTPAVVRGAAGTTTTPRPG